MAPKKKRTNGNGAKRSAPTPGGTRERLRRTDEQKVELVRQIMQSGNQSAEIKKLGIYPNQFYDWKKKFAGQLGVAASIVSGARRGRSAVVSAARSAAEEAKAFIHGKASLLERLRAQREELDGLISQLEG
jgi:transposase-like protein